MSLTTGTPPSSVDQLAAYRQLATDCVSALRPQYDWRANWHRRFFRLSGIIVIVISAALPLLAVLDYAGKEAIVAAAGFVIAGVTGLRTFYHWDHMWGVLRRTHFELTHAYNDWQLAFRHAEAAADPAQTEQLAYEATKTLLDRVKEIRTQESDRFFEALSFPPEPKR